MPIMIAGLLLFVGMHSIRLVAPAWRQAQIDRLGMMPWRGIFSLLSLVALGLIIWGFGQARTAPQWIWYPPHSLRHVTMLLMLVSFVLLVAAYVPGNRIKAAVGHPMLAGVKTWAFAHLLVNGALADMILFGSFLAWAIAGFVILRRRDRANGVTWPAKGIGADVAVLTLGIVLFVGFAHWGHVWLIGVNPFQ